MSLATVLTEALTTKVHVSLMGKDYIFINDPKTEHKRRILCRMTRDDRLDGITSDSCLVLEQPSEDLGSYLQLALLHAEEDAIGAFHIGISFGIMDNDGVYPRRRRRKDRGRIKKARRTIYRTGSRRRTRTSRKTRKRNDDRDFNSGL